MRKKKEEEMTITAEQYEIPWRRAFYCWQQFYGLAGPPEKEVLLADFRKEISQEDRRLADVPDAALAALLRGEVEVKPVKGAEAIRFYLPAAPTAGSKRKKKGGR
jgi:hypothetical protein